jgi:flavodoxin
MAMKSLVIYHSRYGYPQRIAWAIAEGLSERGSARAVALADVQLADVAVAHLVVIGAPTHMKGMSWSMRRFLRRTPREAWFGRPVAVFDTRFHQDGRTTGSAAAGLSARLRRRGALLVARPESFFVTDIKGPLEEGELARATLWGRSLHLAERVAAEGE